MDKKWQLKIKISKEAAEMAVAWLFLGPAIVFWTSIVMYKALGTDYFYDVVLVEMARFFWGNAALIVMVLVFPVGVTIFNFRKFLPKRNIKYLWGIIVGLVFVILGIVTAFIGKPV